MTSGTSVSLHACILHVALPILNLIKIMEIHSVCTDENSILQQQRLDDEYGQKADSLEDRIEAMKDLKGLRNDFNKFITKCATSSLHGNGVATDSRGLKKKKN